MQFVYVQLDGPNGNIVAVATVRKNLTGQFIVRRRADDPTVVAFLAAQSQEPTQDEKVDAIFAQGTIMGGLLRMLSERLPGAPTEDQLRDDIKRLL